MPEFETYVARGGQDVSAAFTAAAGRERAATRGGYTITVRFMGGLSDTQRGAFKAAADRWSRVITGDLPAVTIGQEQVDDLLILAQGQDIDGPRGTLGMAGPTRLRPAGIGAGALLPAMGEMTFDSADLEDMEERGTLNDVIAHEMGHVIGIGTIWSRLSLLRGAGTANPRFTGRNAMREFGELRRNGGPAQVPVENTGGEGTADGHWRDSVFGNELMTGFVADPGNPLSRLTIACLQDMGYTVDMAAAEPYEIPDMPALAAMGALRARDAGRDAHALGTIPMILPPDSVVGA